MEKKIGWYQVLWQLSILKILLHQKKEIFWINDAGHIANIDNPVEYNNILVEIISKL